MNNQRWSFKSSFIRMINRFLVRLVRIMPCTTRKDKSQGQLHPSFLHLPPELQLSILNRVPLRDILLHVSATCTLMQTLCSVICTSRRALTLTFPGDLATRKAVALLPLMCPYYSYIHTGTDEDFLRLYPRIQALYAPLDLQVIREDIVQYLIERLPNIVKLQLVMYGKEQDYLQEMVIDLLYGWAHQLRSLHLNIELFGLGQNDKKNQFHQDLFTLFDRNMPDLCVLVFLDDGHSLEEVDLPVLGRLEVFYYGGKALWGNKFLDLSILCSMLKHAAHPKVWGTDLGVVATEHCIPLGLALARPDNQCAVRRLTHNRLCLIDEPSMGTISQQMDIFIECQILTAQLVSLNITISLQFDDSVERLCLVYEQFTSRLFRLLQSASDIRYIKLVFDSQSHISELPSTRHLQLPDKPLIASIQCLFVVFSSLRAFTRVEAEQISLNFHLKDIFPNLRLLCINQVFVL